MRIAALSLVLVAGAFAAAESATGPDLVRRREYFHLLRPGVAMAEIAADLGPPDSVTEGTTTYRLDVGRVDLTEQDGLLASADHRDPGQGTEASSLYHAAAGALRPSATELDERDRRMVARDFLRLDRWGAASLRTDRHPTGLVFLLRDGYVVLEEVSPLMGAEGAFANLIARATVHRGGETHTVWRLFDVWARVRPSYLSPELLAAREATLTREGHLSAAKLARKLGDSDGHMGSGRHFDQYYLHDGLLVLSPGAGVKHLGQPGLDEPMTLAQWLQARRAGKNAR